MLMLYPESSVKPKKASKLAVGHRMDHSTPARQDPHLKLRVRDWSNNGVSAIVDKPVETGEEIAISVGSSAGVSDWAYGHVVQCRPGSKGYQVSVEFDPRPAA
jgi:hypothetical protein